jgi:molybdate transport system substrate-binding protein
MINGRRVDSHAKSCNRPDDLDESRLAGAAFAASVDPVTSSQQCELLVKAYAPLDCDGGDMSVTGGLRRRPSNQRLICALAMLLMLAASRAAPAQARDLVVSGEPTLATVLGRLGAAWREQSGVRVNVFVAPTDLSLAQIERGARCDVLFALAGPSFDDGDRRGIVKAQSSPLIIRNGLVLVTRRPFTGSASTADRDALSVALRGKSVAIANPDRDVAGLHGRAWLQKLGGPGDGDKALRVAESAAGVVTLLHDKVADFGIVYATDAAAYPDIAVVAAIPEESYPPIRYVAVEAMDPQSDLAPFMRFLRSQQAKSILQAAGLQMEGSRASEGRAP